MIFSFNKKKTLALKNESDKLRKLEQTFGTSILHFNSAGNKYLVNVLSQNIIHNNSLT